MKTNITVKFVCVDSVSELKTEHAGTWVFCGSHGGRNASAHALEYKLAGIVFNDAGVGKEEAGISGLALCEDMAVPAACVSHTSARIGDGQDTFVNGVISCVNQQAKKLGINTGLPAKLILEIVQTPSLDKARES